MRDWAGFALQGRLQLEGGGSLQPGLPAPTSPLRAWTLARDRLAPWAATAQLLQAAGLAAELQLALLDAPQADHFSGLKQPQPVVAAVRAWLQGAGLAAA